MTDRRFFPGFWLTHFAVALLCGSGIGSSARAQEPVVAEPLPAEEAARTMLVPEGFQVTVFAGEPDVCQPIAFCIDDRGRLWVAEAYNYPHHGTKPGDRILIFTDTDGDGRFDQRTVFYDQLNYVTGIEVGFGGAWVMSPPYFYFIPDRDGDDRPDGPPEVLLDGFGNHANSHNLANGFAWGPDGWLYGTHGRTNWSVIGKPGTPAAERVRFDGGVYRYHPVRHVWEPYSDGSTNPWGIDWDDWGEAFVCNCVDPHLFHVIQGAHYEPWRNRQSSQFAYARIPSIADHLHFVGQSNVRDGLFSPAEDAAGGGHAHSGTMIYLGDNWPAHYRNMAFMHNIHGKRINNDLLRRQGSGYTATHGKDLLLSRDPWFMGVNLRYGPDGGVYATDWSDTGECHSVKNTHRETGRIYKITYGRPKQPALDLAALSDRELVQLQRHPNDWFVRHARRLLQERAARGQDLALARQDLLQMFASETSVPRQLRALWTLWVLNAASDEFLIEQLNHPSEYVRAWCVRLLCEGRSPSARARDRFQEIATTGHSAYERLWLASSLQRLPESERWPLAKALLAHAEDADDANLPLMIWYGIEPLVHTDAVRFVSLSRDAQIPLVRRHIARRVAELPNHDTALTAIIELMGTVREAAQRDLLEGALTGLEGRRSVRLPDNWPPIYRALQTAGDPAVRERALELALIFDDPTALETLRQEAADTQTPPAQRVRALRALVAKKPGDLETLLTGLIADAAVQSTALRGLAECSGKRVPEIIIEAYPTLLATTRPDAVQTLASRPAWALRLLDEVEAQRISRSDLSAFTARQLLNLKDERVTRRVNQLWGNVRTTAGEKARLIADYKKRLSAPQFLARGDRSAGRALYQQTCANCHKLFDAGGEIGPNITGSQRQNLDYLLENLIDPSGAVSRDFQMQIIETQAGRVITGLVVAESDAAVTIQTVNEKIVVPASEIATRTTSNVSMMPDGLLQKMTIEQVRDLIAYLSGNEQVPLKDPPSAESK
ncbi:MAG: c-type cytochrome [Planctomycetes bacterium]|nr:c-type cytochrome [Planctomycetota bacterium]